MLVHTISHFISIIGVAVDVQSILSLATIRTYLILYPPTPLKAFPPLLHTGMSQNDHLLTTYLPKSCKKGREVISLSNRALVVTNRFPKERKNESDKTPYESRRGPVYCIAYLSEPRLCYHPCISSSFPPTTLFLPLPPVA